MKRIYFLLISIFLTSCASFRNSTSTIVSCNYNEKKNQTEYMVFPYGQVSIPGKWERTQYNSVAHQQFFTNSDSITITITFATTDKYEFNKDGTKKNFEFVKAFYEWESEYFATYNLDFEIIESDSTNNFIIWRLYGSYKDANFNTYFLIGEKNGFVKNYSVMTTEKWETEQKIDFLKNMYLQNKKE